MQTRPSERYRSWLVGELALALVLAVGTVLLFLTGRLDGYSLPNARISLDTAVAVMASMVAVLAATRFLVEGRAMDLLLAGGFLAIGIGTFAFAVAPALSGTELGLGPAEIWAAIGAGLFGSALISFAPYVSRTTGKRRRALAVTVALVALALLGIWMDVRYLGLDLEPSSAVGIRSPAIVGAYGLLAVLSLIAVVGFGLRYRRHGRDLDSWLTLALTLVVFADLHYVLAPLRSSAYVLPSDVLRLLAFAVLLAGVWRAIGQAEFGRAVAEERARVARDIHDGLAQYLFAISAQISMLESGAELAAILPRLKFASTAAQQEAQFAVLALSSASGSAPFDAALRRYVDFLVADGELDVEIEVDPAVTLGPDEEIEVFRIVQEGLANVRKHAGARNATVSIVQRNGRRVVCVSDDGAGITTDDDGAGQGLKNMRSRAASIEGVLSLKLVAREGDVDRGRVAAGVAAPWKKPCFQGFFRSRPVSRILSWVTISLGRQLPDGSSGVPGSSAGRVNGTCFALHRTGFGEPPCHHGAGGLLPHRFTLTGAEAPAVSFLCHCPSAFAVWDFPSVLPCGVRTFLERTRRSGMPAVTRPAGARVARRTTAPPVVRSHCV